MIARVRFGFFLGIAVFTLLSAAHQSALAATDAGTLLRQYEKIETAPAPRPPAEIYKGSPSVNLYEGSGAKVLVKGFAIDASRFPQSDLQSLVKDYVGKSLSLRELQEAARKIGAYYREHDYLARALVPEQKVKNGIVKIVVIEGLLGKIKVDQSPDSRADADLAKKIIAFRAPIGKTLRPDDLNEGVSILNEIPGVRATAALEPGDRDGETNVILKTEDAPLADATFQVNNESSRSVGIVRGIASGSLNNALGFGDRFSALMVKTNDSDYGRLSAEAPIGFSGLTAGINVSAMTYNVDPKVNASNQKGHALTGGMTAAYPLLRQPGFNLTATAAYDHKKLVNAVSGTNSSNKSVDAGSAGFNAVVTDSLFDGASNIFSAQAAAGWLDLTRNAGDWQQDMASAKANGLYGKYSLSVMRLQNFDKENQLLLSTSFQFASENLDSSEQMSLGGPEGVRAYPTDEATGDEGFVGRVEFRHNLFPWLQAFNFYDAGWIRQHANPWNNWNSTTGQPNDYWLQGFGAGVSVKPLEMGQITLTVAHTLGTNPGQTNGRNSDGYNDRMRFWLKANLLF